MQKRSGNLNEDDLRCHSRLDLLAHSRGTGGGSDKTLDSGRASKTPEILIYRERQRVAHLLAESIYLKKLWRDGKQDRQLKLGVLFLRRRRVPLDASGDGRRIESSLQKWRLTKEHDHSFGDKPLIDVSTNENNSLDYAKLQSELLSLSHNSKQLVAEKSGHFVIIDRPDAVIDAISQVVQSVRKNSKL
jgi:hypothetical protein